MADAVFQGMVKQTGLSDHIRVDSAGTGPWHVGEKVHAQTLKLLKKNNIPYDGRARQFAYADLDEFDYVLAMDKYNLAHIQNLFHQNKAKVGLFLDYAKHVGTVEAEEVPDPYGSADAAYLNVFDLVTKGSTALLAHIRAEHGL